MNGFAISIKKKVFVNKVVIFLTFVVLSSIIISCLNDKRFISKINS